jgi:hypothetical protein
MKEKKKSKRNKMIQPVNVTDGMTDQLINNNQNTTLLYRNKIGVDFLGQQGVTPSVLSQKYGSCVCAGAVLPYILVMSVYPLVSLSHNVRSCSSRCYTLLKSAPYTSQ